MGVLRYIPPTKKIVDNRSHEGNFYEAVCDNCGTKFYPKRSNAKYCSSNCCSIRHRREKVELIALGMYKPKKNALVDWKAVKWKHITGAHNCYRNINGSYNTRGDREEIFKNLKNQGIYPDCIPYIYGEMKFYRMTERTWRMVLNESV